MKDKGNGDRCRNSNDAAPAPIGKTPRVSITRPAPRAILIKVKAIVSSPSLRALTITRNRRQRPLLLGK
jgi:hypothetical protein